MLHPFRKFKWCKSYVKRRCNQHFEREQQRAKAMRDERMSLGMYTLLLGNGKRFTSEHCGKRALVTAVAKYNDTSDDHIQAELTAWTHLALGNKESATMAIDSTTMYVRPVSFMSPEEINSYLNEHGDNSYEDLPYWLRHELSARQLSWPRRIATSDEYFESQEDARIHRVSNNELTIQDYEDYYTYGKRGQLRSY